MPNTPILQSERLIQCYYCKEDFKDLERILSDKNVMEFVLNGVISKKSLCYFLDLHFAKFPNYIGLGVLKLRETQEIIGFSGIHRFNLGNEEKIEIGFVINTPFQGKGYGLEIGLAQIEYLKLNRYSELFATVHPQNIKSIDLIKNKLLMQEIKIIGNSKDRGERILFQKTL